MKKKYLLSLLLYVVLVVPPLCAQTALSDSERVFICAFVPESDALPLDACQNIETLLQRLLAENGIADKGYAERFVLTAKIDVLSKDVVPSTPPRVSQRIAVTFMVGDVVEDKLFETCAMELSGVGTNETKALIAAFADIAAHHEELCAMLAKAKEEIVSYYTSHCAEIVSRATTAAGTNDYDEAIFQLMSIPNVCADCYAECQQQAQRVYTNKINYEGATLLNSARVAWAAQPTTAGAAAAAEYLCQIDPLSTSYVKVDSLLTAIETKLKDDEQKAWALQVKQVEEQQALNKSIVDACKTVGVTWAKRRPRNWLKSIISGWW